GPGWIFSEIAIANSFSDFVDISSAKPVGATLNADLSGSSFSFHSWRREQGMPRNSIRAMTQTGDGYIWLGSDDGLARFDGVRFVAFDSHEALHGSPVRALFGDTNG